MNQTNWKIQAGIVGMALLGLCSLNAMAMGDHPNSQSKGSFAAPAAKQETARAYFYDGQIRREVQRDESLLAEFMLESGRASAVASMLPSAMPVKTHAKGVVHLWDVSRAGGVSQSLATLATTPAVKLSPVFHINGQRMALPGGVLVTFEPGWSADQVAQWAQAQQLELGHKLNMGNVYLVGSDVGLASLDLANRIHESGQVVSASPNWWYDLQPQ